MQLGMRRTISTTPSAFLSVHRRWSGTASWNKIFHRLSSPLAITLNLTAALSTILASSVSQPPLRRRTLGESDGDQPRFPLRSAAKCSAGGKTTNRKNFTSASVSTGGADLVRDNGFNAGIDTSRSLPDLEFDFSRSVPLQLNSYSFGIGVDLSWLLRPHAH